MCVVEGGGGKHKTEPSCCSGLSGRAARRSMFTTERRRMSLHEMRRKEPVRVSAGSLWQESLALELSGAGSNKHVVSPRSRTRALSVAYIVNEDASVPQSEENLSLKCLKEACADAHAVLETVSFERISLGTTGILDSFYNAGKCRHADSGGSFLVLRSSSGPSRTIYARSHEPFSNSLHRRGSGGDERLLLPAVPLLSPGSPGEFQHDQQHHPVLLQA